jgi:hypothetical protein
MVPYAAMVRVGRESVKTCFREPGATTHTLGARRSIFWPGRRVDSRDSTHGGPGEG